MSESAVRQKVFEVLSAIPGIGKVYNYERWAADWGTFINLFKDPVSGRILGWEISRPTAPCQRISNIEIQASHAYVIKGYMAVNDADQSELVFEALIELIRETFRLDITLDGVCSDTTAISKTSGDTRMFGNVLCHYAELTLTASEY